MRKIISIIIIIYICTNTVISYATDFNELKEQRDELQNQIQESTEEKQEIQEELSQNLEQIQKIDENIAKTQSTLDDLNDSIGELEGNVAKIKEELEKANKKFENQKKLLDERLVAMYESGTTNYLDVVLSSSSITDFLSSYYLITEITNYDMEFLEEVDNQRKEIENKKLELESEQKLLEKQKQTQVKTKAVLENSKIMRENYISKLSDEERALQEQIDTYNAQVEEIEKEIKSLAIANIGEDYIGGVIGWPIKDHYTITSKYGMRTHPITGVYKLHTGIDISATTGTEFLAVADGVVVKACYNAAYGNMVIIDHGGGVQTLYAHGSEIVATVGQTVLKGDCVLKVGSTGYSTGPHAHFEIRINGNTVNPLDYISPSGEQVKSFDDTGNSEEESKEEQDANLSN